MEWNVFVSVSNRNGVGDEIKSNCLAHLNLHFLCLADSLILCMYTLCQKIFYKYIWKLFK